MCRLGTLAFRKRCGRRRLGRAGSLGGLDTLLLLLLRSHGGPLGRRLGRLLGLLGLLCCRHVLVVAVLVVAVLVVAVLVVVLDLAALFALLAALEVGGGVSGGGGSAAGVAAAEARGVSGGRASEVEAQARAEQRRGDGALDHDGACDRAFALRGNAAREGRDARVLHGVLAHRIDGRWLRLGAR